RGEEMAADDRTVAGRRFLAAAEGVRPPRLLVGGREQIGAVSGRRAQYLAAERRRAAERAGNHHEPARCRHRHAARHLPDRVSRQRQGDDAYRPEAALRLHGLVADLALRQQRAPALQRPRCALGPQLLHRSPATGRGWLSRRVERVEIAAAALSPLAPYFDAVKDLLAKYDTNEFA